jgi:hypothetical protein
MILLFPFFRKFSLLFLTLHLLLEELQLLKSHLLKTPHSTPLWECNPLQPVSQSSVLVTHPPQMPHLVGHAQDLPQCRVQHSLCTGGLTPHRKWTKLMWPLPGLLTQETGPLSNSANLPNVFSFPNCRFTTDPVGCTLHYVILNCCSIYHVYDSCNLCDFCNTHFLK